MKILFIFAVGAWASVVKLKVLENRKKNFSYREVCRATGNKHLLLIEASNSWQIDCMGKLVSVVDFCKRQNFPNPFLRGYVDRRQKKVVCQSGHSVQVGLACNQNPPLCQEPLASCQKFNKLYAHQLTLIHRSIVHNVLNCYYAPKVAKAIDP